MSRTIKTVVVCAAVAGITAGTAGAASARVIPSPVTVTTGNGGVQVWTGVPGQPLLSASADKGGVCVGFSYEQGTCVPVTTG